VDELESILSGLRVEGEVGARCGLCASCRDTAPEPADASFLFILAGQGWVGARGVAAPACVGAGDLLLVPRDAAIEFADGPGCDRSALRPVPDSDGPRHCRFLKPEGVKAIRVLCGNVRLQGELALAAQPLPFIHVRTLESPEFARLRATMDLIVDEAGSPRAGGPSVLRRLVELLVVQALRAHAARQGGPLVLLSSLQEDKPVARTLKAMHEHPGYAWTVDRLAQEAACSRTVYLARFASLVGQPPLRYLTALRMSRAKQQLLAGGGSVERVAECAGYGSVQAFTRAFKRSVGLTPTEFRARHRSANRQGGPAD